MKDLCKKMGVSDKNENFEEKKSTKMTWRSEIKGLNLLTRYLRVLLLVSNLRK